MKEENKLKNVRNAYSVQAYSQLLKEIEMLVNVSEDSLNSNEKISSIKKTLKKYNKWKSALKNSELSYSKENQLILKFN